MSDFDGEAAFRVILEHMEEHRNAANRLSGAQDGYRQKCADYERELVSTKRSLAMVEGELFAARQTLKDMGHELQPAGRVTPADEVF